MMALLFALLGIGMIVIFFSFRKISMSIFFVSFVLAIIWFMHHATEKLNLNF